MSLQKILSIVVAVISIIGAILWIMIARAEEGEGPIGLMLNVGKGLVLVAAIIAMAFSLKNMFSDAQKIKKTLTSVAGFLVLVVVSYVLSEGVAIDDGDNSVTEGTSKWIGTGLYLFYLLIFVAFGIMIFFGLKKSLKK